MNNNYTVPNVSNGFDYEEFLSTLGLGSVNNDFNNDNSKNIKMSSDKNNTLFGSYEGYIRGNIFKNLYDEYKNYNPVRLPITSEMEEMLINLNQMHFAMHEMNLYLDVFPNDMQMMKEFVKFRDSYRNLLEQYESKYGALCVSDENLNNIPFGWEEEKFPWEGDK